MSNLTPQDVDVKLTATRNELAEEDARLWEGLEDEKVSRIAGDEANKQFTMHVQGENASTESRLSTEVIHRSEGDLTNITSLNALAVALSEYRIKTDLEITNEKIARQQLGVDLNTRVDYFVASWDHEQFLLYQAIQTVQADVNNKYSSMDVRIRKYENMLQDITTDSIQITMDNGEINMGAWTILSQAREWDLEILTKVSGYQDKTTVDLNQALEDIQNKLPVEQNIIDKAIEVLSNAPIIKALDDKLTSNIADIGAVNQDLLNEITTRQNEMVAQAQNTAVELKKQADALAATISAESSARIDALQREAQIRQEQLLLESQERTAEIDQRISELDLDVDVDLEAINKRIDDANNTITELNQNLDRDVAAINERVDDVNTKADDINVALGEQKVELNQSIEVISAKADAIKAESDQKILDLNTKADGIHDEVSAETAARIAAVTALNNGLTSEIQHRKDGDQVVTTALENYKSSNDKALANVRTEIAANVTATTANATKIDALDVRLTTNEEETGEAKALAASATQKAETALTETSALASKMTTVNASIDGIKGDLAKKADAAAFNQLKAEVVEIDGKVLTNTQDLTALKTTVTGLDGKVTGNASAISELATQQVVQGDQITQLTSDTTALKNSLEGVEDDLATKVDSTAFNELSTKVDKNASDITVQAGSITKLQSDLVLTNKAVNTKANASALTTLDTKVSTIDGKVTSNTSAITNLSNRVGVTEGAISKKADAAALSSLDTKVTAIDGKVTTQGTSITKLQNDLATTNQNVATKADATALSALSNTVTEQGGKITANSTAITDLNNKVSIVENDVAKKADASAVSSLSTKVGTLEGTVASQGTAVTKLQNDLALTNTAVSKKAESSALNALDSKVTQQGNTITSQGGAITKLQNDVSSMDTKLDTKASSAALSALDTKVTQQGGVLTSQGTAITKLENDLSTVNTELDTKADSAALNALDSKVTTIDGKVTSQGTALTSLTNRVTKNEGDISKKAEATALTALTTRVSNAEDVNTSQGTAITTLQNTVNHATTGLATKASTSALTATNSEVTRIKGVVTGHANQLTQLSSDITTINGTLATKANASALNDIYTKTQADGKATEIAAGEVSKFSASLGGSLQDNLVIGGSTSTTKTGGYLMASYALSKNLQSTGKKITIRAKVTFDNGGASGAHIRTYIGGGTLVAAKDYIYPCVETVYEMTMTTINRADANKVNFCCFPATQTLPTLTVHWVEVYEGESKLLSAVDANATAITNTNTEVARVDGRVTTESTRITTLTGRVDTVVGNLATKADASALTALDTKVTNQGGLVTSQGTAITKLTNDLTALDTKTDTKASSSALSALDSKVTSIDGRVTSQGTSITTLTNRMTLAEGTLSKKAESSAVTSLDSKVTKQGLDITSQGAAITRIDAAIDATNLAVATKASAAALSTLDSKVTSIDGKVSSNTSAVTSLTGRVTATEVALTTKASVDAVNSLTTRITSAEGTIASQATSITSLNSGLVTTNTNVTAAQTAANKANTLAGGKGKVFFQNAEPAVADRLVQNLWIDTTGNNNTPKRWLTNAWVAVNDKIATDALKAANAANVAIATKADASALSSLDSKVTSVNGTVTSQGVSITNLNTRLSSAEEALTTKANSSAVSSLDSKVTQQGNTITSQGTDITKLKADLDLTNTAVSTKASSEALQSLDNRVVAVDGRVTTNASAITTLSGKMTTVENGLATKADTSAVNALTTRVGNVEGGLSTQASDMTALKSSLGLYVLPTDKDTSQQNKWARITLRKTQPYIHIIVVPDYSYIGTYPEHSEGYFAEGATTTLPIDNSINYYRTLINVAAASTINLGNLMCDDAHAIYVDGKEVYRKTGFSTNACSFEVTAGDHVVDIVVNNGLGGAGFSSTITMSSQVSSMYAPKLTGVLISNKAEASAIQTTNTEVSRVNGVVVSQGTQLTNLNATLTTLSGTVNTKADAAALTSLTTRVTKAEGVNTSQGSSITSLTNNLVTANTAINTKASSAAVATLDNKVTAVDGKVTANTNDLTVLKSTVDSNQAYILNNYHTKTDANTATANQITQFKSTLTVGARNLLLNSDFRKELDGWGIYANTVTINQDTFNNKLTKYAYIRGGTGGIYKAHAHIPHTMTATDDVTMSVWVRGTGTLRLGFNASFKDYVINNTSKWVRVVHTQKAVSSSGLVIYLVNGTYLDVALPKLELGSIPTEWSPAPEDDINDIETTATAVNSISTQVSNIDGRVSAQASQVLTLESFTNNIINGVIPGNKVATVNLTAAGYDRNTWYPVAVSAIKTTERTNLAVYTVLNQSSVPPWATHAAGFSCNLQWSTLGSGWGVNQVENNIETFTYAFSVQSPIMGPRQLTTASKPYVWLRGGGTYKYSLPQNNTLEICQPNGTIAGIGSESVGPIAYNANTVPLSVVKQGTDNRVQLQQTNEVVDGVKAVSTVSVDNNGFISGYGLISQLINGVVQSAFGVNADYFYVGTANNNKKKPFMVLTSPQTIGGVTYPAGTWMDVALIANATIGTAHIQDASITNAKIKDLNADKITAGTLDANRIGANSITAEKLVIGDTTNLWGNQYFESNVRPNQARTAWYPYTSQLKGRGVQMWGRDHMAPYSTRIPLKAGDEFVIEFSAGLNTGPYKALGVGLWIYDATGSQGTYAYQFGVPEQIATLGDSWYRYRSVFTVADNGSGLPAAYGTLYFQIPQSDTEANPTYWTAGDVVVRKRVGGELIVNGAITADKLSVNQLSAVSATIGTLRTSTTGARTEIRDNLIQIFDSSNRVRVKIGVF